MMFKPQRGEVTLTSDFGHKGFSLTRLKDTGLRFFEHLPSPLQAVRRICELIRSLPLGYCHAAATAA